MTITYPKCNKPVIENSAKSDYSIRPVLLPQPLIEILKPFQKRNWGFCSEETSRGAILILYDVTELVRNC